MLVMRLESAELAKIAINFFLVSTVATTNTLAEICEAIGADWNEIAPALRLDRRIGPHAYLKPGLGIAGGNLERDLVTVQSLAAQPRHGGGYREPPGSETALIVGTGLFVRFNALFPTRKSSGRIGGMGSSLQGGYPLDQKLAFAGTNARFARPSHPRA